MFLSKWTRRNVSHECVTFFTPRLREDGENLFKNISRVFKWFQSKTMGVFSSTSSRASGQSSTSGSAHCNRRPLIGPVTFWPALTWIQVLILDPWDARLRNLSSAAEWQADSTCIQNIYVIILYVCYNSTYYLQQHFLLLFERGSLYLNCVLEMLKRCLIIQIQIFFILFLSMFKINKIH